MTRPWATTNNRKPVASSVDELRGQIQLTAPPSQQAAAQDLELRDVEDRPSRLNIAEHAEWVARRRWDMN